MKIYIATTLANGERAKVVAKFLEELGHTITYKWFEHGPAGLTQDMLESVSIYEVNGVKAADLVVVILPGGRGTHGELGMALALGTPVWILNETDEQLVVNNQTCAFYWHPLVARTQKNFIIEKESPTMVRILMNEAYALRTVPIRPRMKLLCDCGPGTLNVNCPKHGTTGGRLDVFAV